MTSPTPNGWRVIGQKYGERLLPDGNFHDVAEVTIQAVDGATTTLVVPLTQYTPAGVVALGDYWYDRHVAVASLGN